MTPSQRILLLSGPIHTDIAIPLDDRLRASFSFLEDAGIPLSDPAAQWLIFGWGGRSFYLETPTWADLKPMPVFRALTIDRSVMHVDVAGGKHIDCGCTVQRRLAKRFVEPAAANFGAFTSPL